MISKYLNLLKLMLVVSVVILVAAIYYSYVSYQTGLWRKTSGLITHSKVVTVSSGGETRKKPRVKYEYEVDGRIFTNSRISYLTFAFGSSALEYVNIYSEGKEVDVFYDPDNPSHSVLEAGLNEIAPFSLIFIFSVIVFLCFLIARAKKIIRKQSGTDHD